MENQQAHEPESEPAYQAPTYTPCSDPPKSSGFGRVMSDAKDVFTSLKPWLGEQREHFVCFYLNVRHRMIGEPYILAIGSICGVEVHPREVFREAIKVGATAVIFAHNHPSGDTSPSRQDIELTSRLRQVGELCGIQVLDHVVFCATGFVSMADKGWI